MYGLIFLNDLLEDMSVEREPKFSLSGGSLSAGVEGEPRGSAPPWEAADRDTDLADSSCQGVGVRSPDNRCRDKSCTAVTLRVVVDFLTVENRDNLATGAETFLPFRIHEQATEVNIFNDFNLSNNATINRT